MSIGISLLNRIGACALVSGVVALLGACAGGGRHASARPHQSMNLDSLNQVAEFNDSVDANLHFYEHAFDAYKLKFPGVDKPAFMRIAKGKDQNFCLFQTTPPQTCLEVGDKFNDLGIKPPARDAYEAGLLSEGTNGDKMNIRLWASMAQLHFEEKEYAAGKTFLVKVLELEPNNKWAKKLLASAPREKS